MPNKNATSQQTSTMDQLAETVPAEDQAGNGSDATTTATTATANPSTVAAQPVEHQQSAGAVAAVTQDQGQIELLDTVKKRMSKFKPAYGNLAGYFDIETSSSLGLSLPRITGEQGAFMIGDDDLGNKIVVQPVSFSPRWVISCGEDKHPKAKEYLRFSYDGKTIQGGEDHGKLVSEYLENLKVKHGFDEAKASEYVDLFCFLTHTSADGEIPQAERTLHCLQCSPTSKGAWIAFITTQGLLAKAGRAVPPLVQVAAEKRTKGDNKYTSFVFAPCSVTLTEGAIVFAEDN